MYEPADSLVSPRFTGPRTFARLPQVENLQGVDVGLFGMPWDLEMLSLIALSRR
jgi:agmatinase